MYPIQALLSLFVPVLTPILVIEKPKVFGGSPSDVAAINHGTFFYHAAQQGLLANDTNIHGGIRTTLSGPSDYDNNVYCGFKIVEARAIDTIGTEGIIKRILDRVGTEKPVYLSIDIDTIDPAFAPATGTLETGGWSTRELRTIPRGLEKLNLIAADIVEVAVSVFFLPIPVLARILCVRWRAESLLRLSKGNPLTCRIFLQNEILSKHFQLVHTKLNKIGVNLSPG